VAWSDDLARDRHCAQEVAENAHDPAADEGDERPMFG